MAAESSGIFSGNDKLLDCTAEVRQYMAMLNLYELDPEYIPSINQFMQFIQNPNNETVLRIIKDQIRHFKNPMTSSGYPKFRPLKRGEDIVAGSFGQIWESTDPSENIIWKVVPEILNGRYLLPMILQECFVQYIVSQKFPDFAIKIFAIQKHVVEGTTLYFICMERANEDLFAYIDGITRATNILMDEQFYNILRPILVNLIKCNRGLSFVHRDMKTDNFVYIQRGTDIAIKMIDFGMACLTVKANGREYNIKSSAPKYIPAAPCLPQQDMLILLYEFLTVYKSLTFGALTNKFFEAVLIPDLKSEMGSRMQKLNNHYKIHGHRGLLLAVYNTRGTLTVPGGPAHYLTPEYVFNILENIFIGAGVGGAGGGAAAGAGGGAGAGAGGGGVGFSPFASAPTTPVKMPRTIPALPLFRKTSRGGKRGRRRKRTSKRT